MPTEKAKLTRSGLTEYLVTHYCGWRRDFIGLSPSEHFTDQAVFWLPLAAILLVENLSNAAAWLSMNVGQWAVKDLNSNDVWTPVADCSYEKWCRGRLKVEPFISINGVSEDQFMVHIRKVRL